MVRTLIVLIPPVLVIAGWTKWCGRSGITVPRGNRQYAIAAGLGAASISSACYVGLVWYLEKKRIGYWNEYLLALAWGKFNWPVSVLAGIFGLVGKGKGRGLLIPAAAWLVFVWTMAVIH
ncbi:MAG: hypothetical protein WAO10_00180 [Candidatus Sulfotelmatobacter sp.]